MGILKDKSIAALSSAASENNNLHTGGLKELAEQYLNTDDKKERRKLAEEFKKRRLEFSEFLKNNPELVNAEAERALLSAAVGGTYTEEEIVIGSDGRKRVRRTKKQVAPNPAAAEKWLSNRDPENWSEHPQEDPELEDTSEIEEALYGQGD